MTKTTRLFEQWTGKDKNSEPDAYCSPSVVYRLKDDNAVEDMGLQILVMPADNGSYTLGRLDFTLPHNLNQRSGAPETLTILEQGITPEDAVIKAFAFLGKELEKAKYAKNARPQILKYRRPENIENALPLARLPGLAITPDPARLRDVFHRLSSQWGQKTRLYLDIPRPRKNIDFFPYP